MSNDQTGPYAIPRLRKIRRQGLAKTHSARAENNVVPEHAFRDAPPPKVIFNAAPAGMSFVAFVEGAYEKAVADGKVYRPRRDQVLAIEGLLTASPSFFRSEAPGEAGRYTKESVRLLCERGLKFLKTKYRSNLVRVELQLDEVTPHLQFAVLPFDSRGKWSAKNCMQREQLRGLWSEWHRAMDGLGLKRALSGAGGRHEPIRVYYDAINRFDRKQLELAREIAFPSPQIPELSPLDLLRPGAYVTRVNNELAEWAKKATARIHKNLMPVIAAAVSAEISGRRSKSDRAVTAQSNRKAEALEKELKKLQTSNPAPVSVVDVQKQLGYGGLLDPKHFANPIDFLQKVEGLSADQSMGWLVDAFGVESAAVTAAEITKAQIYGRAPNFPKSMIQSLDDIRTAITAQFSSLRVDAVRIFSKKWMAKSDDWNPLAVPKSKNKNWSLDELISALPILKMHAANHYIQILPVSTQYQYFILQNRNSSKPIKELAHDLCLILRVGPDRYDAVLRIATDKEQAMAGMGELSALLRASIVAVTEKSLISIAGFRSVPNELSPSNDVEASFSVELEYAEGEGPRRSLAGAMPPASA